MIKPNIKRQIEDYIEEDKEDFIQAFYKYSGSWYTSAIFEADMTNVWICCRSLKKKNYVSCCHTKTYETALKFYDFDSYCILSLLMI